MSHDLVSVRASLRRLRIDVNDAKEPVSRSREIALVVALAGFFVFFGGGNLDLGPIEARQGLAAGERFGPLGLVCGGWEPGLWPARVLPSQVWAWCEGEVTAASVRWPDAIAAGLLGLLLARRLALVLGARAGVMAGLCLFGGLAWIDRSAGARVDLISALAVVGALDRILSKGSDRVAGLWAAFAVLAGGWPPLAMILLPIVILGRPGRTLSRGLLVPPLLALAAWSVWALSAASTQAWAAALAWPLTQGPAWSLPLWVVGFSLPWGPFAVLAAWRSVRDRGTPEVPPLILGWLQITGVAVLAGTLVPGLAGPGRITALVGLALTAAAGLDAAWCGLAETGARRTFVAVSVTVVLLWTALVASLGSYLAVAVSYYRPLATVLVIAGVLTAIAAIVAVRGRRQRWLIGALVMVSVCLKLAHWGYYVPEWNYRRSQGPWGRAVGQWVPTNWPLHTLHAWPTDLAFYTGRPVRALDLPDLRLLQATPPERPMFFLLQPEEYGFWSERLELIKLREMLDERGEPRIVARTPGELNRRRRPIRTD
ncbi:MAG: hypothetical protein ABI353_21480 [Isosphaeraceae bacterium]